MTVTVRPPTSDDFSRWLELWDAYLNFYKAEPDHDHAARLWNRIHNGADPIMCLVAEAGGEVVGMVHFHPHSDTWSDHPICYLQDLFVNPERRRRGAGQALIRAVADHARSAGWAPVYWQTAKDNVAARRLYDNMTAGASEFIVYQLPTSDV